MSRLFISYSHDSQQHKARVLTLARRLLAAGHDVVLDRFTAHPDPNWPQWMARELLAADVVLCICTPTYRARFEGTAVGGFGVAWEGQLITVETYGAKGRSDRFVPMATSDDDVPLTLRVRPVLPFDDDAVLAHLGGVVGPPVAEPEVHAGWTEASSVGSLLAVIRKPLRPPRGGEGYAPTQLLRAEHAVVPFMGRQELIDDLDRWCENGGPRVRLLHGPGGAGKTRLALEIAARRCREGWRAGPLAVWRDAHAPIEYLDALFRDRIPLFLIVDYAETRSEVLIPLLQRLARLDDTSARVLLVARAKGDWWKQAMAEVPELDRMSFGWADVRVDEVDGAREHGERAAAVFAQRLGREVPRSVRDYGRTVLDRQVEALVAVLGAGPLEGMAQLLRHEDRFLLGAGSVVGLPRTVARRLPELMALYTLAGGLPADEAREWMRIVDSLRHLRTAEVRAISDLLADLFPRDGGGVDGMRPDRVGEALVAREDTEGKLATSATARGRGKAVLTVLTRLAATGQERALRRLIDARREVLVQELIAVARETGDPLGRVTAESLEARPDPGLCGRFALPATSITLRELSIVVTQQLADAALDPASRALGLCDLSHRLGDAGRHEDGLAAIEEAFSVSLPLDAFGSKALWSGRPLLLLARSNRLRSLGRTGEALASIEEAVAAFRRLAEVEPSTFLPGLETALNNLALRLRDAGQRQRACKAAEEAVEIRSRLSASGGETLPASLANSWSTLALCLHDVGRREAALELQRRVVLTFRSLAASQPDEFLPSLGLALLNLSTFLSRSEDAAESLTLVKEAVVVYGELFRSRPDAFGPDFAIMASNLAVSLRNCGNRAAALAVCSAAVTLRRDLARARPDAFLPDLARSLWILGDLRIEDGDVLAGVDALTEAMGVLRALSPDASTAAANFAAEVRVSYEKACVAAGLTPDPTLLLNE